MDFNLLFAFIGAIIVIGIFGKILLFPLKTIIKLAINSVLGGLLIYIINLVGTQWDFYIGLNFITAIFVGILGLPGALVLILLRLFLG